MSDFEDTVCIKVSKRMSDGIERHILYTLLLSIVGHGRTDQRAEVRPLSYRKYSSRFSFIARKIL